MSPTSTRLPRSLKLVEYVVTFPSIRKGKPLEQLEAHAILFEEWQQADGLLVAQDGSASTTGKMETSRANRWEN